eukprot:m.2119 g.2119  ORF g.2119 m.2119 type:complete len:624 (-) comp1722_c0_seq1:90-1961(-)
MIENALVVDLNLERQLGSQIGGLSFFSHTLINLESAGMKHIVVVTKDLSGEFMFAWKGLCKSATLTFHTLGRNWKGTEAEAYIEGMKKLRKAVNGEKIDDDGLLEDDAELTTSESTATSNGDVAKAMKSTGEKIEDSSNVGVPFLVICENHIHDPSLIKMLASLEPSEDDSDAACLVEEDVIGMVGVNEQTVYAGWPVLKASHVTSIGTGLPAYNGIFAGAVAFFPSTPSQLWGGKGTGNNNGNQNNTLVDVLASLASMNRLRLVKNTRAKIWLSGQSRASIEFSRKQLGHVGKRHRLTTGQIVELLRTPSDGKSLDPRHKSVNEEVDMAEQSDLRRKLSSQTSELPQKRVNNEDEVDGDQVNEDNIDDDDDDQTITTEDENNSEWSEFTVSKWRSAVFTTKSFFQQLYKDTHAYIVDQIKTLGGPEGVCIIEVGCGTGETLIPLHEYAQYCIGVDINPLFIEYCRKENAHENVSFVYGDATKLQDLLTQDATVSKWVADDIKKIVICTGNTIGIIPEFLRNDIYISMANLAGTNGVGIVVYWNGDHFPEAVEKFYGANPQLCGAFDVGKHVNFEKCTLQTPTGYSTKWTTSQEALQLMKNIHLNSLEVVEQGRGVLSMFKKK